MENIENSIIELLKDRKARSPLEIIEFLNLGQENDGIIMEILNRLTNDYTLYCSKKGNYLLFEDSDLASRYVKGKFLDTSGEYGFVSFSKELEDIFIHGTNTMGAIDGDTVLVEITKGSRGNKKCEGRIVKIINRNLKQKVGEVYHYENKLLVNLDDKKVRKLVILTGDKNILDRLVDGDKVLVSLTPKKDKDYIYAEVKKRIGHVNDPDIDILSIIAECGFNVEFPESVLNELKTVQTKVNENEIKNRHDLRNEMIFTIDGADTKDIDDAISVKKLNNGNYELGVHIADVSYYVKENSPLDLEARERGTSVYLTDRVIPMYPHQLSNGICSLNPLVDRLAISCVMEISPKGDLVNYDIFESVINSKKKMTYEKVNDYLERGIVDSDYTNFTEQLSLMKELSSIIRKNKINRGFIDFDTDEIKIIVNDKGEAIDVAKRTQGVGESLIEDFMIMANETVASHFFYMDLPSVYRVHGAPNEERLRKFIGILSNLGINIKDDLKKITPKTIQRIIEELKKYPQFKVFSIMMLSCMDKAIYDPKNIGHFGIASRCYTHFTSPIRRYPDTTIHRLLRNYFFNQKGLDEEKINHFESILPDICLHASERERASVECEREVDELKEAEYMEKHVGEEFNGMVSSVTSFGMFVMLDNLIEGLVPLLNMSGYFVYDEKTESLISPKTHERYAVGDMLRVVVTRASKLDKQIDFQVIRRIDVDEKEKCKKKVKTKYS